MAPSWRNFGVKVLVTLTPGCCCFCLLGELGAVLLLLPPPHQPGKGRTTACMTLWPLFYLLPLSCCWLRMASLLANLFQFAENEVPPVSLSLYFGHFHHICQRVLYHQNQQKGILESWHQGLVSTYSRIYIGTYLLLRKHIGIVIGK